MHVGDGIQMELFPVKYHAVTDATNTTVLCGQIGLADKPKSFVDLITNPEWRMARER